MSESADTVTEAPEEVRQAIDAAIRAADTEVVALARDLAAHPEIRWEEHRSAAAVARLLEEHGFSVERSYLGLDTAFRAVAGSGRFTVGFLAEYDALPGMGHACGHHLIAAMSVGAAIGVAAVAEELDVTVEVIGTPAEEGGGGKIELLDRGAFTELDLALMAHPAPVDAIEARPFAVAHWHVSYEGRSAHAAAFPDRGINANDAFLVAQTAIALLRQQLPPSVRVHGIMTDSGQAPNAIPERTAGRWYIRAESLEQLMELEDRIEACFRAGEIATGARLTIRPESQRYAEMRTDQDTLQTYERHALRLGRDLAADPAQMAMSRASTDMGNVSQVVDAIHPYIGVGGTASNHQVEFAEACTTPEAEMALRDGARLLAWTAADVASRRGARG